jgi:hypothetical protein
MRNRHIYKIKPSNRSRLKKCETTCVILFLYKKLHVLLLHKILVLLLQLK